MTQEADHQRPQRKVLLIITAILTVRHWRYLINRFIPPIILGGWNLTWLSPSVSQHYSTWFVLRLFRFACYRQLTQRYWWSITSLPMAGYGFDPTSCIYWHGGQQPGTRNKGNRSGALTASFWTVSTYSKSTAIKSKLPKDSVVRNFAVQHSLDYFDIHRPKPRFIGAFSYSNTSIPISNMFSPILGVMNALYCTKPFWMDWWWVERSCDTDSGVCMKAWRPLSRNLLTEGHLELYCGDKKRLRKCSGQLPPCQWGDWQYLLHEQDGQRTGSALIIQWNIGGPYMSETAYYIIEL